MAIIRTHKKTIAASVLLLAAVCAWTLTAGNLNPAGPPTSGTMKTLDEVEPRIAIPGSDTPAMLLTINQSGSYYLTSDRLCSGHGIEVTVDNVTIDLCGHSLIGSGGGQTAIRMRDRSNIVICNGTISGFGGNGISSYSDGNAKNNSVVNVRIFRNGIANDGFTYYGILLQGNSHQIKDCIISECGKIGVSVGAGSIVTGCTAYSNGKYGFYVGDGSCIKDCAALSNAEYGIYTGADCTIINNTATDNDDWGLYVGKGCVVKSNTASRNALWGIEADEGCTIIGNVARSNKLGGGMSIGSNATVIGNSASNNVGVGIHCQTDCLVDQNAAVGNTDRNLSALSCTVGINHAP